MKVKPWLRRLAVLWTQIVFLMAVSSFAAASGGQPVIRQAQVKAVYLYNFLHFISWPDRQEDKGVKVIGVLGDQKLGRRLTELARRLKQKRRTAIRVILYNSYRPELDFTVCHILFIGPSQADNFKMILARLKGQSILTVADAKHFLSVGGMINLVEMGGRVRYEVNLTVARAAGLRLSSQLLESALTVIKSPVKGD